MSIPCHCAVRRYRHGLAVATTLLISWAGAFATAAHAQFFPPVNSQNGYSALRVTGGGHALSVASDGFNFTNTEFGSVGDSLFVGEVASATNPSTGVSGFSSFSGEASFGTLKGTAVAEINGGISSSGARGTVMFIDLMTILADGHSTRDWNIDLEVDGSLSGSEPGGGAGATVRAEFWVFDTSAYLNGGFIIPAYHKIVAKHSIGTSQSVVLDDHLERLTPGSTWFVATAVESTPPSMAQIPTHQIFRIALSEPKPTSLIP